MANFETPDLAFSSKEGYGEDSGLAVYVAQAIDATLKWDASLAEEHYRSACGGQRGFDRWAIHRVCTEGLLSLSNCLSCLYP